jgi:hypothetical protein
MQLSFSTTPAEYSGGFDSVGAFRHGRENCRKKVRKMDETCLSFRNIAWVIVWGSQCGFTITRSSVWCDTLRSRRPNVTTAPIAASTSKPNIVFRDYKPTILPTVTYGLTKRMQEIGVALDKLDELAHKWQQEDSKRVRRNAKGV